MWKRAYQRWTGAFGEAIACLGMAMRDARHAGLWWRASLWCSMPALFWTWTFYHYGEFFLKLAGRVTVFAVFGAMSLAGGGLGMGAGEGGGHTSSGGNAGGHIIRIDVIIRFLADVVKFIMNIGPMVQMILLALALAGLFYVLLFAFANLTTISLPLRWLILPRAQRVAHTRYSGWQPRPLPALPRRSAWQSARTLLKHVLSLIVPIWSLYVVLRFVLEFNVGLMYFLAAGGVLDAQQRRALMHAQRPAITMLGLMLCVLMLIPFINLLIPALLCSSVCHLQRRGWIDPTLTPPALTA